MAEKKPRRMTQREKDSRAAVKKRLQAEGILPPNKPRLNRKKFAAGVWAEYEQENLASFDIWLYKAIRSTVGPDMREVTAEEVGVLKLIKLAIEARKFHERLKAEGRATYKFQEYLDEVYEPVMKL